MVTLAEKLGILLHYPGGVLSYFGNRALEGCISACGMNPCRARHFGNLESDDKQIATLHAHPNIRFQEDLERTIWALARNYIDICAITTYTGDDRFLDFDGVKGLIKTTKGLADKLGYIDMGLAFSVKVGQGDLRPTLTFVGAYETPVTLRGVEGKLHMVALMPDPGFKEEVLVTPDITPYAEVHSSRIFRYGAIAILAHSYVLEDPHGPGGMIPFRLASSRERREIRDRLGPVVDAFEMTSSSALWMAKANTLLWKDHQKGLIKKPLADCDAHVAGRYSSKWLGTAANITPLGTYGTGEELRTQLRERITGGKYTPDLAYVGPIRFLVGILPRPELPLLLL